MMSSEHQGSPIQLRTATKQETAVLRAADERFNRSVLMEAADQVLSVFARVLGFGALLGALAFVVWGNVHRLL